MKKGQRRREWSKEQKLEIIEKHLGNHISVRTLGKEYNADYSMIARWVRLYGEYGEKAFDKKRPPGNKFAAMHTNKNLSAEERLQMEVVKLQIENERLKKGYIVKGVGVSKEYVILRDVNMKLSTS